VLAAIRELFARGGPRNRDDAVRDLSAALGYGRAGSRIRDVLERDLLTAVRRGILENERGALRLLCRSIEEYEPDHLLDVLLAAVGTTWQTRDDAVIAAARHLGYRRAGGRIQAAFKAAIAVGIRRRVLERDGPVWIRRPR